jgi:NADPH-dependent 2,4-dienoyl-CoA reductase/sulfur reductase-like enzyme
VELLLIDSAALDAIAHTAAYACPGRRRRPPRLPPGVWERTFVVVFGVKSEVKWILVTVGKISGRCVAAEVGNEMVVRGRSGGYEWPVVAALLDSLADEKCDWFEGTEKCDLSYADSSCGLWNGWQISTGTQYSAFRIQFLRV